MDWKAPGVWRIEINETIPLQMPTRRIPETIYKEKAVRIVVTDGYTLNPGDLSWDDLRELGDCTIYDRTPADSVLERAGDAPVVLTNKVYLGREHISKMPNLQYIGLLSTGTNAVDMEAAADFGVTVTNVPGYATPSVAQMVFALLLELCQHVGHHSKTVREGRWSESQDFCYWDYPLVELEGMTMGIVGFGDIGSKVADIAHGFGMRVIAFNPGRKKVERAENVVPVGLDTLFAESDVVSLNCPLTSETERMVDERRLKQMKKGAFLINTSRGKVVDETALARALINGDIAGAGLDVMAEEPPADSPLLKAPNCYITPHIAWAGRAARQRLMNQVVENVRCFLKGEPINVVC